MARPMPREPPVTSATRPAGGAGVSHGRVPAPRHRRSGAPPRGGSPGCGWCRPAATTKAWSTSPARAPPPLPRKATTGTPLARAASAARSRLGLEPLVLWRTRRSPGRQSASTWRAKTWSNPRSFPAARRSEVSVVRATAASARRVRAYRTTNSVARCWASAALPPFPAKKSVPPPRSVRQVGLRDDLAPGPARAVVASASRASARRPAAMCASLIRRSP